MPGSKPAAGLDIFQLVALLALGCAMILWSGTFIAMKLALDAFHPMFVVFVRMVVCFCLLLPFLRGWLRQSKPARGDAFFFLLLVFSEPCLYFLFEGYALRYTSASQASMITAVLPLSVAVFAWFFFKERVPPAAWVGFLLALGGVCALTLCGDSDEHAPNPLLGNSLEFMAILAATSYTLCVRRLRRYHPFFITAVQSAGGAVFFLCLSLALPGSWPEFSMFAGEWSRELTLAVAGVIFLSLVTCLAYGMYNVGVSRLSAASAAAWINLIPALTVFMAFAFLDESLTLYQYYSIIPIVIGVVLSQTVKAQR